MTHRSVLQLLQDQRQITQEIETLWERVDRRLSKLEAIGDTPEEELSPGTELDLIAERLRGMCEHNDPENGYHPSIASLLENIAGMLAGLAKRMLRAEAADVARATPPGA